ncbi:hypothetical protein EMILIAHAH_157 [Bacillus phage vB_BanH_Emiliahah]|nr:hypothetical protein MCCARTNEY_157 [Bacillus phage vB_BanH_McCartney]UGO49243.1 hypothetical protein EMILIAHAH_157 [Bacillus phage vB_BanH_Emiliahah]
MWNKFFVSLRIKRCKQCGETLKMFHKVDFCDLACCAMYREIEKQQKERKIINESNK